MKPRSRWIVAATLVSLLLFLAWGCPAPLIYSSPALEARVVDEDTGQPLEGVIAVVHWQLRGGIHEDAVGELVVMEAVTDATGMFRFPAWGPKLRPLRSFLRLSGTPGFILFKRDYKESDNLHLPVRNVTMALAPRALPPPPWHGQTIMMKKFTGGLEEYARHLWFLDDTLDFAFFRERSNCTWQNIPHMLVAIHLEAERLRQANVRNKLRSLDAREGRNEPARKKCGSVKEFLRSYLK